jgi:hypothetical protein
MDILPVRWACMEIRHEVKLCQESGPRVSTTTFRLSTTDVLNTPLVWVTFLSLRPSPKSDFFQFLGEIAFPSVKKIYTLNLSINQ